MSVCPVILTFAIVSIPLTASPLLGTGKTLRLLPKNLEEKSKHSLWDVCSILLTPYFFTFYNTPQSISPDKVQILFKISFSSLRSHFIRTCSALQTQFPLLLRHMVVPAAKESCFCEPGRTFQSFQEILHNQPFQETPLGWSVRTLHLYMRWKSHWFKVQKQTFRTV